MNFPSLILWPALMIAVPILIHLINLLRHRRVKWAAMEFLLASQKKYRRKIWFTQLLLLLSRMAIIGFVLLFAAQLIITGDLAKLVGQNHTHHFILIDDSFSMSARSGDTDAFRRAEQAIDGLVTQLIRQGNSSSVTLIPFSQAVDSSETGGPSLDRITVNSKLKAALASASAEISVGELATSIGDVLDAVTESLIAKADDENVVIHVFSDFHAAQWKDAPQLRRQFEAFTNRDIQIHLINCATPGEQNLALTEFQPGPGTRAAGVPLMIEVAVTNFGPQDVHDVLIQLQSTEHPFQGRSNSVPSGVVNENNETDEVIGPTDRQLPVIEIEIVPAGKTVQREFEVVFDSAGDHYLLARLIGESAERNDAIAIDSSRHLIVSLTDREEVLIIDGDDQDLDAPLLARALAPGGDTNSGLRPVIKGPTILATADLTRYRSIYLLNISKLPQESIENLEQFAANGGGLAFFLGPRSDRSFINDRLFRAGLGLFPVAIEGPIDFPSSFDSPNESNVLFDDKSIFAKLNNSKYSTPPLRVTRYIAVDSKLPLSTTSQEHSNQPTVLARLTNHVPLLISKTYQSGRVAVLLTHLGRLLEGPANTISWTNSHTRFAFLPMIQDLQGYLGRSRKDLADLYLVGSKVELRLDARQYKSQGSVSAKSPTGPAMARIVDSSVSNGEERPMVLVRIGDQANLNLRASGPYEVNLSELTQTNSVPTIHRIALNVDAIESDIHSLSAQQLASELNGLDYVYHDYSELLKKPKDLAGFNMSPYLLGALIILLLAEQFLAYVASYHPRRSEVLR